MCLAALCSLEFSMPTLGKTRNAFSGVYGVNGKNFPAVVEVTFSLPHGGYLVQCGGAEP